MTDQEYQSLTKEFCRLTGTCWHDEGVEFDGARYRCPKCDATIDCDDPSPDLRKPVEVLRVMRVIGAYEAFLAYIFDSEYPPDNIHIVLLSGTTLLKFVGLMENTTGILLNEAVRFLRREKG